MKIFNILQSLLILSEANNFISSEQISFETEETFAETLLN